MSGAPEPGVVLIVGGTGAIGRATALAFARQGHRVMVAGRSRDAGDEAVSQVHDTGAEGRYLHCDLTDPASIEDLGREAIQAWGRIDIAFNNAGWEGIAASTADIEEADWQRMLDIKLTGAWRCMKFQLGQMQKQGGGSIINMVGSWGLGGFARYGAYCAAAHGLMGLTRTAALEYARDGIRVNAVCPGAVDTPLLHRIFGGDREARHGFAESLPMGRIATPEEIAGAVVWLSSDAASYVNGHALQLTGGG